VTETRQGSICIDYTGFSPPLNSSHQSSLLVGEKKPPLTKLFGLPSLLCMWNVRKMAVLFEVTTLVELLNDYDGSVSSSEDR